jgi:cytochrome oxidase assembly protein ShyY1
LKEPSSRAQGEINDEVAVTGLARAPDTQGRFIPDNEPAENRWFWRDLDAMSRSMFPAGAPTLRRLSLRRSGAIFRAAGRLAARPGSIFPTTTCNMR